MKQQDKQYIKDSLPQKDAQNMINEIKTGDDILNCYPEPTLPKGLASKIEDAIIHNSLPIPARKSRHIIAILFTSAAALMITVSFLLTRDTTNLIANEATTENSFASTSDIFNDEAILWQITFSQEITEDQIDIIALEETSDLWDQLPDQPPTSNTEQGESKSNSNRLQKHA